MEKAMFGAGCFWHVEAAFRCVEGVIDARSGYAGGTVPEPTYEEVCGGKTGHTEVVEVTYDPAVVSYDRLLDVFWTEHDPASAQKRQYRSVIFYHTPEQRAAAEAAVQRREQALGRPLRTAIEPAPTFYQAEEYHQRYYEKHGISGCGL